MADTSSHILAKGSNFIGLLKSIETLHGAAVLERVLNALPQEIAGALRYNQVLTMGWYPVGWYAQLHTAIDHTLDGGPLLARKLSYHASSADFGSMHRFLIGMLSIETAFGQAHRLMALYWKGGAIDRLELDRGRAVFRFSGWFGFTDLLWQDLMGGMEAVLEACGGKHGRCRALQGALAPGEVVDTLEIEVRWS